MLIGKAPNMTIRRIFFLSLALAFALPCASSAAPRQKRADPKDFFARASDLFDAANHDAPRVAPHGDCFRSLTPTEATRGIRHWTGNC